MISLSLAMIVRNEEALLEKSLEHARIFADEIIIVDTGSTDSTYKIAKNLADAVYQFEWINDFAAANNAAQQQCTKPFFFRYDADFWITELDAQKLQKAKEEDFNKANIVTLTWITEYGENNIPRTTIRRPFIAATKDFHSVYPIHSTLAPLPGIPATLQEYPEIHIHHMKDTTDKSHRYKQTLQLVEKNLQKYPKDSRLLMSYAQALLFDGQLNKAILTAQLLLKNLDPGSQEIIPALEIAINGLTQQKKTYEAYSLLQEFQNLHQNDPRFLLLSADTLSLFDSEKAIQIYELFLTKNFRKQDTVFDFDHERFITHPRLMLADLYQETGQSHKALTNCESALAQAITTQTKADATSLKSQIIRSEAL